MAGYDGSSKVSGVHPDDGRGVPLVASPEEWQRRHRAYRNFKLALAFLIGFLIYHFIWLMVLADALQLMDAGWEARRRLSYYPFVHVCFLCVMVVCLYLYNMRLGRHPCSGLFDLGLQVPFDDFVPFVQIQDITRDVGYLGGPGSTVTVNAREMNHPIGKLYSADHRVDIWLLKEQGYEMLIKRWREAIESEGLPRDRPQLVVYGPVEGPTDR